MNYLCMIGVVTDIKRQIEKRPILILTNKSIRLIFQTRYKSNEPI